MCADNPLPTPYPDVNAVLAVLLAEVRAVLGDNLAGMYLYGSLVSGDFEPRTSDVDFVAVTEGEIAAAVVPALEAAYARTVARGIKWAAKLEGAFMPLQALRRYDPADPPRPTINEGRFSVDRQASDWVIQRAILRDHGVVVTGPLPRALIDPVTTDDLRRAVAGVLEQWWAPIAADPVWLRDAAYQAFAVLTMCRALYTLEYGAVVSKPAAARWAVGAVDEAWTALIERAAAWHGDARADGLGAAPDFIRFVLERVRRRDRCEEAIRGAAPACVS